MIFILLIFSAPLHSQIVIDGSDMPVEGDTLRVSVTTNIPGDYTSSGPGMTWDLSALNSVTQQVDTFVNILNTPSLYWFTFIPGVVSNLASPENNLPSFPGVPFSNFFTFFMKSPASFSDNGFAFQLMGLPIALKYNSPDVYYEFPCTMGNTWNSNSFASISLAGLAYFSSQRTRTSVVDGWGTLVTPYGTFQALRVKSELTERDSIFLDTLGMGVPVTRNITEYKWLGKGQGIPLLQINVEGPAATAIYRDNAHSTGINEIHRESLQVFPNPSHGTFVVNTEKIRLPARLVVLDPRGKVMAEKQIPASSAKSLSLDLAFLPQGFYMIRLVSNEAIYTAKAVLTR